MSKRMISILFILMTLLLNSLFAGQTPVSPVDDGAILLIDSGMTYTNMIETTYDDSNWVLVVSDAILRENLCGVEGYGGHWYEKVFNPCYNDNRYWKLAPGAVTGEAFPMDIIRLGSLDSLYVRAGYSFQLYSNTSKPDNPDDMIPYGPPMIGPQYVSVDHWRDVYPPPYPPPNDFEPGTFFVEGGQGGLKYYSIIIYNILLTKTDDVALGDSAWPGDEVTYTIGWENYSDQDAEDAVLTDYLPAGVTYPVTYSLGPGLKMVSSDPNYNEEEHIYTWHLGTIAAHSSGSVELTVIVNEKAEPGMKLHNIAKMFAGDAMIARVTEDTLVCCWDTGNIIYVDKTAAGNDNGTGWADAYIDLQRAIKSRRVFPCRLPYMLRRVFTIRAGQRT